MPANRKSAVPKDTTANHGFETKLWLAADKLRNNMDATALINISPPVSPVPRARKAGIHAKEERSRSHGTLREPRLPTLLSGELSVAVLDGAISLVQSC